MKSSRQIIAISALTMSLSAACGTTVGNVSTSAPVVSGLSSSTEAPGSDYGAPVAPGQGIRSDAATVIDNGHLSRVAAPTQATGARSMAAPSRSSMMPASGPGWTARNVYIGVALETDASTVGKSFGFASFDFGDQKAMFNAAIAAVNSRGGLFGRKLVPIYYDVRTTGDPNTMAEEACALWTQDHRVIFASLVALIGVADMYQCMSKAHVPVMSLNVGASGYVTKADLAHYAPYLVFPDIAAMDRFVGTWLDQLTSIGYFDGWNTSTGTAGNAPVRVGILYNDNPLSEHAWALVRSTLMARHIAVPDFISWSGQNLSALGSVALKFKSDGVTHVFMDATAGIFYPQAAQAQHYYGRYGVSSNNFIQSNLVQAGAPPQQLNGMMGVGWEPYLDVAQAQAPPLSSSQRRDVSACRKTMLKAGVDISKRNYQYVAFASCAELQLTKLAVDAGGGFSSDALLAGLAKVGPRLDNEILIGPGADAAPDQLTWVRPFEYDSNCRCTTYVGKMVRLPS